ncbi:MAG: 50S ribosomal protein L11 methyltransferase [Anaerolineae bacterium]|jgi:ribosomal protein L11 methyltransferase
MMKWLEVNVETSSEAAEAVAEVLSRFAPQGVALEAGPDGIACGPVAVRAYLSTGVDLEQTRRQVSEALWHLSQILPIPEPTFRSVEETNWEEIWKRHLQVLRIGERVVIRPSWLEHLPQESEVVIELDPGMAFGTGLHPTTQLCLMALEERIRPGARLLDLGTGSGILAIASAKLGAGSVLALDTDSDAVDVARRNASKNEVLDRVEVACGSLAQADGTYDLVVVNILAQVIVDMAGRGLADLLASDGALITAGILEGQVDDVQAALEAAGLAIAERRQIEDWVALVAERV